MCGIAGYYNVNKKINQEKFEKMVENNYNGRKLNIYQNLGSVLVRVSIPAQAS